MKQISKEVKKALNENGDKDNTCIFGIKLKENSFNISLSNNDLIDEDDLDFDESSLVYWQGEVEYCQINIHGQKIWINSGIVKGWFFQDESADYMIDNIDNDYECGLDYMQEGKEILNDLFNKNDLDIMFDKFDDNIKMADDTLIIGDETDTDLNLSKDMLHVYYVELHGNDIVNIY